MYVRMCVCMYIRTYVRYISSLTLHTLACGYGITRQLFQLTR